MTNKYTRSILLLSSHVFLLTSLLLSTLLFLLFLFAVRGVHAEDTNSLAGVTRFVSTAGSDGPLETPNPCTSSSTPCQTIQHALTVAADGDEIRVAAGTYSGLMSGFRSDQRPVTATVIIAKQLTALLGGYAPDFAARNPSLQVTTLDAASTPGTFVLYLQKVNTVVDGFSMTGAVGAGALDGGAVFIEGGAPTISGNQIHHNQTKQRGAGIYVSTGAPIIVRNRIYANSADRHGGGIFALGSTALITGNEIMSNVVSLGNGGAIYVLSGTVSIENNVIASNQAISPTTGRGSGVYVAATGGPHTLRRNHIYANQSMDGGSALESKAPILIDSNLIHDNQISFAGSTVLVENVSVNVTIQNNLIYKNHGSGVTLRNVSDASIVNNTIDRNVFVSPGGPGNGIDVNSTIALVTPAKVTILNNILSNNGDCGVEAYNDVTVEIDYNNAYNNRLTFCNKALPPSGSHNIADDPRYVDATNGDYRLVRGSQSIDGGTSVRAPNYAIDGSLRPDGSRFDMGVYETTGGLLYLPIIQQQ